MKKDKNKARGQKTFRYLNIGLSVLCVMSLLCSGVVFALSSNVLPIKNIFQTDRVDIALINNTKTGNKDENGNDEVALLGSSPIKVEPGKVISYIPTITNEGTDAYVRAFISIKKESGLKLEDFRGISDKWQYNTGDGYFYYTDVVKPDEQLTLFNTLNIPTDYDKRDIDFDVKVSVDAIQSRNFSPDFTSTSPWGNVKIESYYEGNVYEYEKNEDDDHDAFITYNGASNKLISNKDDFFSDLPKLVPGDKYKNTMTVYNDFDKEVRLYFEGHPDEALNIPNDLLSKITLKITRDDGKVIFDGNLSEDIPNQEILRLKSQEKRKICYEISFDKDADNAYANIDDCVNWYFNTSFDDKKPTNNGSNGNNSNSNKGNVKTGDNTPLLALLMLAAISGAGAYYFKKKEYSGDVSE